MGSRLAIVGPNGVGKSTLLGLVSGALAPTRGYVQRSPKLRLATFAQHHVDGLDLAASPLSIMVAAFPGVPEQARRAPTPPHAAHSSAAHAALRARAAPAARRCACTA